MSHDLDFYRKQNKELKACLKSLIDWREQPEVRGMETIAFLHGATYTAGQLVRLHSPWKKAHDLLGLPWDND